MMNYSINELAKRVEKTPQAIYYLAKHSKEFQSVAKEHTIKSGKAIRYDEAVLEFLINYYGIESKGEDVFDETSENLNVFDENEPNADENAEIFKSQPTDAEIRFLKEKCAFYENQISALEARLDQADADRRASDADRRDVQQTNAALLLMLQDERSKNQRLLEAAEAEKPTLGDRIKGWFKREK